MTCGQCASQVDIEKELRRQLLEIDEHSSHQARQLELLQEHTLAMHSLAPGRGGGTAHPSQIDWSLSHSSQKGLLELPRLYIETMHGLPPSNAVLYWLRDSVAESLTRTRQM